MSYSLSVLVDIGVDGLTLKAALSAEGVIHETFRDIATGFHPTDQGHYEFVTDAIPNGYRGIMAFYTGTIGAADPADFSAVVVYSCCSINPEEFEVATSIGSIIQEGDEVESDADLIARELRIRQETLYHPSKQNKLALVQVRQEMADRGLSWKE